MASSNGDDFAVIVLSARVPSFSKLFTYPFLTSNVKCA